MKKKYRNIDLSIILDGCCVRKHFKNIVYNRFVEVVSRPSASIQSTLESRSDQGTYKKTRKLSEVVNLLNMDIKVGRASKLARIMKNSCSTYCAGTVSCEAQASHLLFAASMSH